MRVTPDRLAVAEAVLLDCAARWQLPFTRGHIHLAHSDLHAVIEAIPEPEPQPDTGAVPRWHYWENQLAAAHARGVVAGLERAAKIADAEAAIGTCDRPTARQIASKIRAAKEEP